MSLVALLCRTSDRTAGGARGARALADALGARVESPVRAIGSPGEPRVSRWDDDLRDSHGCLLEAGGQVDDALAAERFPLLFASDCSICVATLPALVDRRPEARILWLDAHADFNTPATTPSGFLGGMCLSAACGRWDSGFPGTVDPARVVMCGVRDIDPGERGELELSGVVQVARPRDLPDVLEGARVYVHLDLDVLDPTELPAQFPAPGGLLLGDLEKLLTTVAESVDEVIGLEVTAFDHPEDGDADLPDRLAAAITPLLPLPT